MAWAFGDPWFSRPLLCGSDLQCLTLPAGQKPGQALRKPGLAKTPEWLPGSALLRGLQCQVCRLQPGSLRSWLQSEVWLGPFHAGQWGSCRIT